MTQEAIATQGSGTHTIVTTPRHLCPTRTPPATDTDSTAHATPGTIEALGLALRGR